jgi:hypothetical protein
VRLRPARVAGERVLASATAADGELAGTREALHLPDGTRLGWERVEAADWDRDAGTLRVTATAGWGEERPAYVFALDEPDRLLQLVRERVTATVLLQRHVPIHGKRGVRVIGRRAPGGPREVSWFVEYDEGLDPADPFVDQAAQEALADARDEVGEPR